MVAAAMTIGISAVTVATVSAPAQADACYTWNRVLKEGTSGEDVRQLQIRVSGYPGYNARIVLDGKFGPATKAAVIRFQKAYGLAADGVAGTNTYSKIYALQDADCTPVNFSYAGLNRCNSDWSGGPVSAKQAKANALVTMWKLQALRKALGNQPIQISSGFRSHACNNAVGGASTSRHLYGDSADMTGSPSLCTLVRQARYHGFREILGPGYSGHGDRGRARPDVPVRTRLARPAPAAIPPMKPWIPTRAQPHGLGARHLPHRTRLALDPRGASCRQGSRQPDNRRRTVGRDRGVLSGAAGVVPSVELLEPAAAACGRYASLRRRTNPLMRTPGAGEPVDRIRRPRGR
ncbi:D-Ala-D-Ala carboxypeptidase family metallohydrolase [Micromonospora sp. NPDC047074]|uniref:D-Ala-D-Ala carboxypeptidase family metallohydrolase n=1 Tax=Micromonospora sp. NPDC047074 TaxID=3154339 RepID=UPI0034103BEF